MGDGARAPAPGLDAARRRGAEAESGDHCPLAEQRHREGVRRRERPIGGRQAHLEEVALEDGPEEGEEGTGPRRRRDVGRAASGGLFKENVEARASVARGRGGRSARPIDAGRRPRPPTEGLGSRARAGAWTGAGGGRAGRAGRAGRSTYWAEERPDLLKFTGLECQILLDFWVEWKNQLIGASIPEGADVSFETVRDAAADTEVRYAFHQHLKKMMGRGEMMGVGEIASKRKKISRPQMAGTLTAGGEWLRKVFSTAAAKAATGARHRYLCIDKVEEAQGATITNFAEAMRDRMRKAAAPPREPGTFAPRGPYARPHDPSDVNAQVAAARTKFAAEVAAKTLDPQALGLKKAQAYVQALKLSTLSVKDGDGGKRRMLKRDELRELLSKHCSAAPAPTPAPTPAPALAADTPAG